MKFAGVDANYHTHKLQFVRCRGCSCHKKLHDTKEFDKIKVKQNKTKVGQIRRSHVYQNLIRISATRYTNKHVGKYEPKSYAYYVDTICVN